MIELKPCPFCGSKAEYWLEKINDELWLGTARCVNCYIKYRCYERPSNIEHKAAKMWNTRH